MSAANDRRIETGLGRAELQAPRRDLELLRIRKIPPEQPGSGRDLDPIGA